jgi:hypothetical protein
VDDFGDDDEFTGLFDANLPRADLVAAPANGVDEWLVMKGAADGAARSAGLLDPEFVRDLIAKAEPDEPQSGRERAELPNGITLTGSPAAMAAFIHKASERQADPDGDVAKAEMKAAAINDLPDSAFAYIESGGKKDAEGKTTPRSLRHFPLNDAAHVRNALSRAPQSPFGGKAMPKIRAAAKKFGIDVAKEAAMAVAAVAKDDMGPELDDGVDGMDPTVPLAEPDEMGPGDPTDPGSPAWESIDAATAQKWVSIAVRLKNALSVLAEREMVEAASADPGDCENAWDLEDAQCAVDYVISTLAVFAAGEQAEADLCGEAMEAIGKAMAGFDPQPLDAIEGLCAVAKSGRVLSSANEAHIREAAGRLNTVLSSLPSAPATDDGQPVAKEGTTVTATATADPVAKDATPDEQAGNTEPANAGDAAGSDIAKSSLLAPVYDQRGILVAVTDPASILQRVAKADDGDGKVTMQAVFDEKGNLVGIVDPADITPVSGAGGSPDEDPAPAGGTSADTSDMTPQPPAETGTPADAVPDDDAVAKQDQDTPITLDVLKSTVAELLAAALGAQAPAQDIAKQADVAGLAQKVDALEAELAVVKEQPAAPKVFTNGQVPPAHQMRGQDQGGAPQQVDVAKARERKAELYAATGPDQARIAKEMQGDAIAALEALHAGAR